MMGIGLRSVIHARSSTRSFASGCSTYRNPRSFSQPIMSRACWRSVQPWFASPVSGLSVTERMASTITLSVSRPSLIFRTLNSAASRVFCRTTSGVSMPMVNVVTGALAGS